MKSFYDIIRYKNFKNIFLDSMKKTIDSNVVSKNLKILFKKVFQQWHCPINVRTVPTLEKAPLSNRILFSAQNNKNKNLSFTAFEIQFKIRDLRLYYSTVHLIRWLFWLKLNNKTRIGRWLGPWFETVTLKIKMLNNSRTKYHPIFSPLLQH